MPEVAPNAGTGYQGHTPLVTTPIMMGRTFVLSHPARPVR